MRSRIGAISCITALRTVRREAAAGDSTKASARRPLIIPSPSGGHHASAEFFAGEDSVEDAASGAGRDAHLFDAGVKRAQRGVQFGLHTAGGDAVGDQLSAGGSGEEWPDVPGAIEHAFDIGEEDELAGAEGGGAGDGHLIGVDVVDLALAVAGHAGHYGHVAVGGQQVQQRGVGFSDAAHSAQGWVHLLGLHEEAIDAGDSNGKSARAVDGGHQFVIDAAGEDFEHGVDGFGRGDAETADEGAPDTAFGEVAGHLLAAAVDHGDFVSGGAGGGDFEGQAITRDRGIEQGAAEFHQQFHNSPSVSGQPSIRFMFWMAWPAAPLTRLSMALTTTARLVGASKATPIWQKLVRVTPRRSGVCRGLKRRTKGSAAYWRS